MRRWAVSVHASVDEGFGMVVVEAMAAGAVVVASEVGAVPEIVDDGRNGLLFPALDRARLAELVVALLQDPHRRSTLRDAALETVRRRFSAARIVQQLSALYDSLT